jgi:hypothetical protein
MAHKDLQVQSCVPTIGLYNLNSVLFYWQAKLDQIKQEFESLSNHNDL